MKHMIPTSVVFMALSLLRFLYEPSAASVALFAACALFTAFLVFVERKSGAEIEQLRAEIAAVRSAVTNVTIGLGWGGQNGS